MAIAVQYPEKPELDIYLLRADLALSKKEGNEFQALFVDIASATWGADFEDRRPQGKLGDKKCDGYRVSTKTVYQCYGPRTMEPRKLEGKILEDFHGARGHFNNDMLGWSLVHNDTDGLPTTSHELLMTLRREHPELTVQDIGPRILLQMVGDLTKPRLQMLFPGVPSAQELRRVNFAEIDELMRIIDGIDPDPTLDIPLAPSAAKLEHNKLPQHVISILKHEQIVASRFSNYFADTSRAEVGSRVSERFKSEYRRRKEIGQSSDQTFFGLLELGGGLDCDVKQSATLLGFLGYLFFSCEIFEDMPRGNDSSD